MRLPTIVAKFGFTFPTDANHVIMAPPVTANKKLLAGINNRLEMAMGMKNTNEERPFASSLGESLNVNATVSNKRKRKEAYRTERRLM
jgi:hypothetical protein